VWLPLLRSCDTLCTPAGANCTAFGKESTHCLDAEFYDWICPTNYTCTRQQRNAFFYQCIPVNKTAMAMEKSVTRMDMMADMESSNSSKVIITSFNKTIDVEKLPEMEQEEVSKCLGWPMAHVKKLKSFEMCGGMGEFAKPLNLTCEIAQPAWHSVRL
jgi:hypothetical protein